MTDPPARSALETWLADEVDLDLVRQVLYDVIDPELGVDIVDLGLLYGIEVTDRIALIHMTLTTPGCPLGGYMNDEITRVLVGLPGIDGVDVAIGWDPPWSPDMMTDAAKRQLGWRP